jgi:hypothetical protein
MNDDIKLLSMLLRYAQRRMVAVEAQVQAHLGGDLTVARAALARLERQGLVYVEGAAVRLTLPGFAHAVSAAQVPASVHRLGRRAQPVRSRAA